MARRRPPQPPATVRTASAKRRWRAYQAELDRRGLWETCDVYLLDRLVLNLDEAANALTVASKRPWVAGSTGQLVAHPGFAVASRCDQTALSLARQLNLTPATRGTTVDDEDDKPAKGDPFQAIDELARRRAQGAGAD